MATRGTYRVEDKVLYNHWDNYPQGAAVHFLNILKTQGNFSLKSFLKCDEGVNFGFANSIFDGPAEYFYEINRQSNGEIYVGVCDVVGNYKDGYDLSLRKVYEMSDFINDRFKKNFTDPSGEDANEIEQNRVLRYLVNPYSERVGYITVKMARERVKSLMKKIGHLILTGNRVAISSALEDIESMLIALDDEKAMETFKKLFNKI